MTHDYKRNGVTSLFAAMDIADGWIISKCMNRHRHQERSQAIHLNCDKRWLGRLRLADFAST